MAKKTVLSKKKRGPPATGKGTLIGVRLQPDRITALDAWISAQSDHRPSRPEAIRCLVDLGLAQSQATRQTSRKAAARASEMASEQVAKLMGPLVSEQEQRARKRRLIKGPREFRQMRADQMQRKPK